MDPLRCATFQTRLLSRAERHAVLRIGLNKTDETTLFTFFFIKVSSFSCLSSFLCFFDFSCSLHRHQCTRISYPRPIAKVRVSLLTMTGLAETLRQARRRATSLPCSTRKKILYIYTSQRSKKKPALLLTLLHRKTTVFCLSLILLKFCIRLNQYIQLIYLIHSKQLQHAGLVSLSLSLNTHGRSHFKVYIHSDAGGPSRLGETCKRNIPILWFRTTYP